MAKRHVWIVEMWNDITERWEPTVGCSLSRAVAREDMGIWREQNPDDDFRLRKYTHVEH